MIDHDHQRGTGRDHVRGLVCRSCNARLGLVDASVQAPTAEEARYLGDAWFLSHPPARQVVYDPADESAAYAELDAASANYLAALAGRDAARDALREGIVRHLRERSGPPGKLAEHTPYDRNHVGRIGRDHGVPPLRPQPTPTRKRKA